MTIVHSLSVDVEGFCEGSAESCCVPPEMIRSRRERDEIAANVDEILEFFDQYGVKATFFTLGVIGAEQPGVVRRIATAGHEIASHSYDHLRLFNLSDERARDQVVRSKHVLEDASGGPVYGFRAPEFSVCRKNEFLLEVIRDTGYRYDSSIYPISYHDVYGIKGARRDIHMVRAGLVDCPPSTLQVFGRTLPVLGGGYLRLFPMALNMVALHLYERKREPAMIYIHPYELGSIYPRLSGMTRARRLRRYGNLRQVRPRFEKLFRHYAFGRVIDVLRQQGYDLEHPIGAESLMIRP